MFQAPSNTKQKMHHFTIKTNFLHLCGETVQLEGREHIDNTLWHLSPHSIRIHEKIVVLDGLV